MSAKIKKTETTYIERNKQIRALVDKAIAKQGITVAELARKMNINYTAVWPYIKGNKPLSFRMIAKFETALNINLLYVPKTLKTRK